MHAVIRRLAVLTVAAWPALFYATACSAAVSAHAALERSTPASGATLAAAPSQVDLFFGQQLVQNRTGTFARVFSDAGATVSDDARLDPQDGRHLQVPLRAGLDAGRYTVFWKTTSDEDGGVTLGSFDFVVGQPSPAAAAPGGQVLVPDGERSRALSATLSADRGNTGLFAGLALGVAAGLIIGGCATYALVRRARQRAPVSATRPARDRRR